MKLFSTVLFGCTIFGLLVSACTIQPTPVPTVVPLTPAATTPSASVTAAPTFQPSITPRPIRDGSPGFDRYFRYQHANSDPFPNRRQPPALERKRAVAGLSGLAGRLRKRVRNGRGGQRRWQRPAEAGIQRLVDHGQFRQPVSRTVDSAPGIPGNIYWGECT